MSWLNRLLPPRSRRSRPARRDALDPLPYWAEWPSLRSATGRVDIHSLAAFWIHESAIRGDYYEFGVASGRSAISAIRAARLYGSPSVDHFRLFDSFQGLPELTGADAGSEQFHRGDYAYSLDQTRRNLQDHGAWDAARVTLYPGWFEKTMTPDLQASLAHRLAAIVHLDCDLHSSAAVALAFVRPLLQRGTILLVDDYNCFQASSGAGLRRALREWTAGSARGLTLQPYASYGWHGQAFIVDPTDDRAMPGAAADEALEPE